jgi:iron complex transport system ATP-binding protein
VSSDIVMMGRYPFFSNSPGKDDREICKQAVAMMQSEELAMREYSTLSGGEAQKVQMARVLAQIWEARPGEEKVLFLDEPVSHLDLKYKHQLLETAKQLCKNHVTVIAILHDINLALMYADHIIFLKQGQLIHETMHPSAVTSEVIKNVFDVNADVIEVSNGRRVVVF